jgi:hypothetical protein
MKYKKHLRVTLMEDVAVEIRMFCSLVAVTSPQQ